MSEEANEKNAPLDDTSPTTDFVTKQKKRYARNRLLALIGLGVFLVFGGGYISVNNLQAPSPPVSEEAISSLTIIYSSPYTLEVGMPATFSVLISNSRAGNNS
jgi:hypothetical protein